MNIKLRNSIKEDIDKCRVALAGHASKNLFEVLYAKYHLLDNSIDDSIPKYAHAIGDADYRHELKALMSVLETYLLCDSIPAKIDYTSQDDANIDKLPSNSEQLLRGLLEATNRTEYLARRFKNISDNEDEELMGIIRELIEKGYINVAWADDLPYYVTLNNSARTYFERITPQISAVGKEENNAIMSLYDVFISHANTDKNDYVNQLKESLDKLGIQIFYDKDTLEWGDNWKDKILEGVQKAEFAIIVISDNFFGREWTEKELQEFLSRQNTSGQKIILPILHNITLSQIKEQYPTVADIQALNTSDYSCDEIAIKFAKQLIKRLKEQSGIVLGSEKSKYIILDGGTFGDN